MTAMRSTPKGFQSRTLSRVTCPHCWERYPLDEILWVAEHGELRGDSKLGPDYFLRFLPSRFTADGDAIDSKGRTCHQLACPNCHLTLPRSSIEIEPLFISVLGTPGSGKSYVITSAMWKLREILPHKLGVSFADADLVANATLTTAEEQLFLNPDPDKLIWLGALIAKTQAETGEKGLYDTVTFGSHTVSYLRPYMFTVRPAANHPGVATGKVKGRALYLYDNAGEHYLPGQDTASTPVTRHLAVSRAILFIFDPTQDPRFRDACQRIGVNPPKSERDRLFRQETTLNEAATRARKHAGLNNGPLPDRVLIVVVSKYDTWSPLLGWADDKEPWWVPPTGGVGGLDVEKIEQRSELLRTLLMRLSPEIVSAADGFATQVVFIPVSALGEGTEIDPATGNLGIRPRRIAPIGVAVPLLYALFRSTPGLIPKLKRKK